MNSNEIRLDLEKKVLLGRVRGSEKERENERAAREQMLINLSQKQEV